MATKRHPPLTPYARHLMREIAAGRNRLWSLVTVPNGWIHIERACLATREAGPNQYLDRAELTDAGREWLRVQAERFPQ
jgi:hypothetical protein